MRDGARGRNVPSQPAGMGTAPWEAARAQSAETRCDTALLTLRGQLRKGPLQLLSAGGGLLSIGRVGRIEARLVRGGFQSRFVLPCPFLFSV